MKKIKFLFICLFLIGTVIYAEVIFNGPVSGGKGGNNGIINGEDGNVFWNGKNITECLSKKTIDVKKAKISIKNDVIQIQEEIPLSYCK